MNRPLLFSFCILHSAFCVAQTPIADPHAAAAHTFVYTPPPGQSPEHVNLAGDFNNWSGDAMPMKSVGDHFEIAPTIPDGVHYYKFVVDGKWITDPADDKSLEVDDNYGGKNSGVFIGPDGRKLPAPVADKINVSAVMFDPNNIEDCNVVDDHTLRLAIRTQAADVDQVDVVGYGDAAGNEPFTAQLTKISTAMGFDRFGGLVTLPHPHATASYDFRLTGPSKRSFIADGKAFDHNPLATTSYHQPMTAAFDTPDWAKHAVWYQIFPERFRNGDPSNDPPHTMKWTCDWYAKQPGETGDFYRDVWARRYGGDLQGIDQELPYLRSLGVNAIYLNPIFEAEDLHKYDTTDYRHVDQHFGFKGDIDQLKGETDDPATWQWTKTDRLFLDLLAHAHAQGFKVIVDGVFNHTGKKFWAFQDVVKNGKASKFADWFDVTSFEPFHYNAWDGKDGALPAFKKHDKLGIVHGPREHILAIAERWLAPDGDPTKGVDGFRLDAPENVPHAFWVDFRKHVKAIKPDAYIDGEIWNPAGPWLKGDEFDGVMNYQFAMLSQQFFVNQKTALKPSQLAARANELLFKYPFQSVLVNQNLFDSHDTDRAASMFVNPDLAYDSADRIQDNGPRYNPRKPNPTERQKMLQEVVWQMTFVGAPMIYYGDEAGMWGADDPSDRQPMIWKDLQPYDNPEVVFDQEKFDHYRKLIAIRRHFPQLQTGFFRPVLVDDGQGVIAYSRELDGHAVTVFLNRSDQTRTIEVPVGDRVVEWLGDNGDVSDHDGRPDVGSKLTLSAAPKGSHFHDGYAKATLPPYGSAIFGPN